MLPCMTASNPQYLPVVSVPLLVLSQAAIVVSKSTLPVTLPFSEYQYRNRLSSSSTKDTLTCYLPRPEVHSTCNYQICSFFSALYFCWSRWSGSLASIHLIHPNFTCYTSYSPLSSHRQLSLTSSSLYPRRPSSQLSHLFLVLLLKSDENVMETYCQHYQHSTQSSQTHRSTGHYTCIFMVAISESCAEARGLQKPRVVSTYTLRIL